MDHLPPAPAKQLPLQWATPPPFAPPGHVRAFEAALRRPWLSLAVIVIACLALVHVTRQGARPTLSRYRGALAAQPQGFAQPAIVDIAEALALDPAQVDSMRLDHAASLSAAQIDTILSAYGSPATGSGDAWVLHGQTYGIDPAYGVAFFVVESTAGTHPNWAGLKDDGGTTHNIGNIICAGYGTCYGRFRDYPSWDAGIEDWFRLIAVEYIEGRGHTTIDDVLPIYAPAFENDVEGYKSSVAAMVARWRRAVLAGESLGR